MVRLRHHAAVVTALLLFGCAVPLRAQWIGIGNMAPGQRFASGVRYQNADGVVRLTVVRPGIIRVCFTPAPEAALKLGRSFAVAQAAGPVAPPRFTFDPGRRRDVLETSALKVVIARQPFRLAFYTPAGRLLDADAADGMAYDPAQAGDVGGARVRVWKQLTPSVHFYGLGEKTGPLDKRGQHLGGSAYVMWNSDQPGYNNATDPLYADIPFFLVLDAPPGQPALAHGVFFDNTYRSSFDMGKSSRQFYDFGAQGGPLNYYLIAGPTPKDVLRRYAALTGRIPMPPLWSLGYNQCRYSYYPASNVLHIAEKFRQLDIPADVVWMDIGYMRGYRIFTWSPQGFPHPRQLLARLHQIGFHAVTIIDPGVKQDANGYAAYASGVAAGIFAKYPDGQLFVGPVWPGPAVFPDFTQIAARQWWASQIAHFAAVGVDGIWNDMNEPSVFNTASGTMPDRVVFRHDGQAITAAAAHNVFGQQMSRATRMGLRQLRPEDRPFVLTRATYAGGQRYAALWTGDNTAHWSYLSNGITTLLGMNLSGFPFVGNDIGGFIGAGSPDLWTRWVEAAAFFPFMRGHATPDDPPKEPWAFGSVHTAENRRAIERRYQYLPYIYNIFYQAAQTGLPMMRPLVLAFPNDPNTYKLSSEYLFGHDLLVAPILHAATTSRGVYFPAGTWYRLENGHAPQAFTGPGGKTVQASEGQLPLFARAGAILFLAPGGAQAPINAAAEIRAPVTFDVLSQTTTERTYYEDDGETFAYQHGAYFRRTISYQPGAVETVVTLSAAQGSYRPPRPDDVIELHWAAKPAGVELDGAPLAASLVRYNRGLQRLRITIPQSPAQQTVRVRW
ncbi:MAG: glycoside hydrolase family 31 protein [Terriglobales bacterium]